MFIKDKAQTILEIKDLLDEENKKYKQNKRISDSNFSNLLMSKAILKQAQILYWNHKELRFDLDFMMMYELAASNYKELKEIYTEKCQELKTNKILIKDRQRQLSKMVRNVW